MKEDHFWNNNSYLLDLVKCKDNNIFLREMGLWRKASHKLKARNIFISHTYTHSRTVCNIDGAERLRNYYRIGHVHCVK